MPPRLTTFRAQASAHLERHEALVRLGLLDEVGFDPAEAEYDAWVARARWLRGQKLRMRAPSTVRPGRRSSRTRRTRVARPASSNAPEPPGPPVQARGPPRADVVPIDVEPRSLEDQMKKYTTIDGLAETLGVTPRHISNLIRRGLPVLKVGKSIRIDEAKALAWLQATGGQPPRPEAG